MRTITLEEHFLADGFRERIERTASSQGRDVSKGPFAERYAKLSDLGSTRLKDMDAGAVDLQVISHTAEGGRILYSVDYPYSTNERGRAFLDSAPISPLDKEKISHLNAERLLKLPLKSPPLKRNTV